LTVENVDAGLYPVNLRQLAGALARPSRSVKSIVVLSPVTGPNGAARSIFSVEKRPVLVVPSRPS
jgi:hypothetical protein